LIFAVRIITILVQESRVAVAAAGGRTMVEEELVSVGGSPPEVAQGAVVIRSRISNRRPVSKVEIRQ
jgi:hypothetical protein